METYSQYGQDYWVIHEVFREKKEGYFLDLAAANGKKISNTYLLEKKYNWNGICIEPNPKFHKELQEYRDCILDYRAVSDKNEEVDFRIDNGVVGGIVAPDTDNYKGKKGDIHRAKLIKLNAVSLEEILENHNAPSIIDYFSLDVEGSEDRIISSFDFGKYKFNCITIERPSPIVNRILKDNDYLFVKNYKCDTFYIHADMKKKTDIKLEPFKEHHDISRWKAHIKNLK